MEHNEHGLENIAALWTLPKEIARILLSPIVPTDDEMALLYLYYRSNPQLNDNRMFVFFEKRYRDEMIAWLKKERERRG